MMHLLASDYSIILLIKGGNLSGTHSYQALVQSTFGFPGFLVLSALQFLYPFIGESYFGVRTCTVVMTTSSSYIGFIHYLFCALVRINRFLHFPSSAMISYNITTGDTLTKVFQRIPGGAVWNVKHFTSDTEILETREKTCFTRSGSRPHPRRAPLCDLSVHGPVHAASVTLQKHREAREGESDHGIPACFAELFLFLAAGETPVRVSRCPCCRWCWPWPSSSPWSSELPH